MATAAYGAAAFEPFEHGVMLWSISLNVIFVLYDSPAKPRWQQFTDSYTAGMPDSDPSLAPPPGLQQPIRGIGLVWRQSAKVRERLGWATGPEIPYLGAFQIDMDGERYMQSNTGQVYHLSADQSNWELLH